MPRGRKRTPTNILDARGAFRKNPKRGRERADEPVPAAEIGPPPEHFNVQQQKAWEEIVERVPPGTLGDSDRFALEVAAVLLVRFRTEMILFPMGGVARLQAALAALGLTPADRSRITAAKSRSDNPFARNGRKAAKDG